MFTLEHHASAIITLRPACTHIYSMIFTSIYNTEDDSSMGRIAHRWMYKFYAHVMKNRATLIGTLPLGTDRFDCFGVNLALFFCPAMSLTH